MKMKIKGEFTVETDSGMMNNVRQPLSYLELEAFELSPIKLNGLTSKGIEKDSPTTVNTEKGVKNK